MLALFERFDVLALPCAQVWPFDAALRWPTADRRPRDGHLPPLDGGRDLRDLRRPAVHQRAGRLRPDGLPMGLQLIGRPQGDAALLRLARAYELAAAEVLAVRPSA